MYHYLFTFALFLGLHIFASAHAADAPLLIPTHLSQDCNEGSFLVSDDGGERLLRYSSQGALLAQSPSLGGKIQDILLEESCVTVLCGGFKGRLVRLNQHTLQVIDDIPLGHTPSAITLSADKNSYWLTLRHEQVLLLVDCKDKKIIKRIPIGREPVDMISYHQGKRLLIANNLPEQAATSYPLAAALRIVDTEKGEVSRKILLPNGSTDVQSIAYDKGKDIAYVTHLLARHQLPTNQLDRGWMNTNALSIIDLKTSRLLATTLLDTPQRGAANPAQVLLLPDKDKIIVALAGCHELAVIDKSTLLERIAQSNDTEQIANNASFLYGLRTFVPTGGKGPRYMVQCGNSIVVAHYFSGDLQRIDLNGGKPHLLVKGEKALADTPLGRGELYFHDATLCFQQWQSCASCHPNQAREDGLNWDLLNDGIGNVKNTKSLMHAHQTPPSMVRGIRDSAELAVEAGFKHIFFAMVKPELPRAIDAYLCSIKDIPSPYLTDEGQLSADALKGKVHFDANCASCHSGPYFTNQQQYAVDWATGREQGKTMDVPSLRELWRSAPYLYDGRTSTIKQLLQIHGPKQQLSPEEMQQLELYLKSI